MGKRAVDWERKQIRREIKELRDQGNGEALIQCLYEEPIADTGELRLRVLQAAIDVMQDSGDREGLVALLREPAVRENTWLTRESAHAATSQVREDSDAAGLLALLDEPVIRDSDKYREDVLAAFLKGPKHGGASIVGRVDAAGIARLSDLVSNDPNEKVRFAGVQCLVETGDAAATPALLTALADESGAVRVLAVQGVAKLRAREAVPQLVQLLGSGDFFDRDSVPDALVEIRDERAIPLLDELAQQHTSRRKRRVVERTARRLREAVGAA